MEQNIDALIVDDEERSRNVLIDYLNSYCPNVNVVGEATNVLDAVKKINKQKPKLVFLDIEMPGGNGFELFDFFDTPDFLVVFVTAYQNFAIKAFEVSALDYLTKPIKIKQLIKTVQRAKEQINTKLYAEQLKNMKNEMTEGSYTQRIALPHSNGIQFFDIDGIQFIEADGSYSNIKYKDKIILATKKLSEIEKAINHPKLFKTHRSFIVNLDKISKITKTEGDIITMNCGKQIPLSRYRKEEFYEKIQS